MNRNIYFLKFQITRIKSSLVILRENNQAFVKAMQISSLQSPNKYGDLDRIIREFIVIKVYALIDKDRRTFSLRQLKNTNIDVILEKHKEMLAIIKENRDKAFGHHEKEFIMSGEIISTLELLSLQLENFLDEIKKELQRFLVDNE